MSEISEYDYPLFDRTIPFEGRNGFFVGTSCAQGKVKVSEIWRDRRIEGKDTVEERFRGRTRQDGERKGERKEKARA